MPGGPGSFGDDVELGIPISVVGLNRAVGYVAQDECMLALGLHADGTVPRCVAGTWVGGRGWSGDVGGRHEAAL